MLDDAKSLSGTQTTNNVARQVKPETQPQELSFGPLKTVHVFWLAGMSFRWPIAVRCHLDAWR